MFQYAGFDCFAEMRHVFTTNIVTYIKNAFNVNIRVLTKPGTIVN